MDFHLQVIVERERLSRRKGTPRFLHPREPALSHDVENEPERAMKGKETSKGLMWNNLKEARQGSGSGRGGGCMNSRHIKKQNGQNVMENKGK